MSQGSIRLGKEANFRHIDGLVQKRRNTSALAMEFHLFCIKPSIYNVILVKLSLWVTIGFR